MTDTDERSRAKHEALVRLEEVYESTAETLRLLEELGELEQRILTTKDEAERQRLIADHDLLSERILAASDRDMKLHDEAMSSVDIGEAEGPFVPDDGEE